MGKQWKQCQTLSLGAPKSLQMMIVAMKLKDAYSLEGKLWPPCLLNLYAEYIMRNAQLDEAKTGMKISGININNLRYADDTTILAKSKEEVKSLLMKGKESEKAGFKTQHSENYDHGIWSHHFMANTWGNSRNSDRLNFLGLQNHCRWWLQPWN